MDVRCEKCSTEYEFDEERVGANGVTVKCTACGYVFKVRRPRKSASPRATTSLGKGPQGREWLVKKPDGQMIAFRELTTLQKWIVEGRIHRDDEISKNGETWKRLGNILELEPFFSVYEKARALNDLIERGAMEGQPVELRGSEVLQTMNPITSLPIGSRPSSPSAQAVSQRSVGPEYAHGSGVSSTERGMLDGSAPPPPLPLSGASAPAAAMSGGGPPPPPPATIPPTPLASQPMAPAASQTIPPGVNASLMAPSNGPNNGYGGQGAGSHPGRGSVFPTPVPQVHPPPSSYLASSSTPAPGARPTSSGRPMSARSSFTDSMSIPIDDSDDSIPLRADVVERFTRQQRRRKVMMFAIAIVVLGGGGGALTAKYGPPGNPVQVFAAKYGLLSPKVQDDGASGPIEEAQRAFDLDSLQSLDRAANLLDFAQKVRTRDPTVRADRALSLITRADMLRRIAADEEVIALDADNVKAAWQAEVQRITAKSKLEGKEAPLPQPPVTRDSPKLKQDAIDKRQAASKLLEQAFDAARSAYDLAPDALEPARALAEYYRVQQDKDSFQRELGRAKTALEKSRATDSALLYTEAAAARMLSTPPNDEQAIQLLEQALTTRPAMNRARVLLARIHLGHQRPEIARAELDKVLAAAPDHQEASYLKETAAALEKKGAGAAAEKSPEKAPDKAAEKTPEKAVEKAPEPAVAEKAPANPASAKGAEEPQDLKTPEGRAKAYAYYMQTADRLRERDRARQALASYEKAADLKPESAEPLVGMGWAYIDLEKAEAALNVFRRAIRANSRFADAYYGEAEAHRILGQREQAIEYYEKYLERSPNGTDRKAAERTLEQLRK
jgi:predicted Zn finger-like uncharacterized protein